jgi:hypothetical protein
MGYLKRRRSRMRDALGLRKAFPAEVDLNALDWASAREWTTAAREVDRLPFVRFAVRRKGIPDNAYNGVFETAYALAQRPATPDDPEAAAFVDHIREILKWFEENLVAPDPGARRAVFWFRSRAVPCIERVWELTRLLKRAGFTVLVRETDAPGKIVYQDENQIAALRRRSP